MKYLKKYGPYAGCFAAGLVASVMTTSGAKLANWMHRQVQKVTA